MPIVTVDMGPASNVPHSGQLRRLRRSDRTHFKGEIKTNILLERVKNCSLFADVNNS